MFEIATQFNAIFRAQTNAQKIAVSLLSMWTTRRVHSFLTMLKAELRHMEDSASLRDALDACVFFAASMGRLGADFTSLLPPLFEEKMVSLVEHFWKEGSNQLAETLKICREAGVVTPLSSSSSISPTINTQGSDVGDADLGPMPPPRQLMAYPPLGRLVNAFLTGLNELRRCLLPGIFSQLRASLEHVLDEIETILQANERAVMTPGLRGEAAELRAKAKEMHQVMTDIVTPYVRGALELSLGNEIGAKIHHEKLIEFLNPPPPVEEMEAETEQGESNQETAKDQAEDDTRGDVNVEASEQGEEGWNDGLEGLDDQPEETTVGGTT